jgi:hypothetical protein
MTTVYDVHGPLEIPDEALGGSRGAVDEARAELFAGELADSRGVFLFGVRTARGIVPRLIGRAPNGFAKDVFRPERVRAYQGALEGYRRARPVLLLVARPAKRGRIRESEITEIAQTILSLASMRSDDLQLMDSEEPDWAIQGVLRSGPGRLSRAATELRRIIGVETR